ncbi:MAG: DUF4159 domain-containing protein [Deltaproteobacteria bacterium]
MAISGGMGIASIPLLALGSPSDFVFCQVSYNGNWNPRPRAFRRLLVSVELRTSVGASFERKTLSISDPNLFNYPFLYLAGDGDFAPFSEEEAARLRKFIRLGGGVLIDDASGREDSAFDSRIREEFSRILPETPFSRISDDSVIYKSFYLLNSAAGRKIVRPHLEGISFTDEDRIPVIYSRNDMGGAWSEDELGKWEFECVPGGEYQRESAFRLGINIVIYALTGNYKKDQIHSPFIKRREMSL